MVAGREDVAFERRVLQALEEALETSGTEREALLAELAREDARLADEVAQLLAVDRDSGPLELHGLPAVDVLAPAPPVQLEPGQRVGAYELVRPIGSGGMGEVFEAMQERPHRRVALKMLRFGLDSTSSRRRFEIESEILARLRHPAIAQVYEAGVHREESVTGTREIPYFALEFVEGARHLAAYVREERLDRRAVLELFARVCDAVHHGHQRGVIHRDLKPGNVLVGSDGALKVIDFGVARATAQDGDKAQNTRTSEIVGTLSAMSPEQVAGDPDDLDLRCDVYALGVLLYELLSGRRPYDLERLPLHEATRRIVEQAPDPLRAAVPDLPRELETITATALAKARDDRYASALDLAEDVRRFLRNEPIRAQPVGLLRRTTLFVRRNRVAVGAGVLVFVTLLGALIVSLDLAAERQAALEDANVLQAELLSFSQEITFSLIDELQASGVKTSTRESMVQAAVEQLEGLERRAGDDPEVLRALADSYLRLGDMQGNPFRQNLGDTEGARESLARAQRLTDELLEREPADFSLRVQRVKVQISLADVATVGSGPSGAAPLMDAARESIEELVRERPEDPDARLAHARVLWALGFSQHANLDAMMDALDRSAAIYRDLLAESPGDDGLLRSLLGVRGTVGSALIVFGRVEEAQAVLEECRALIDELLALKPDNIVLLRRRLANSWDIARLLERREEPPAVILAHVEQALEEVARLREMDPDDAYHAKVQLQLCLNDTRARLRLANTEKSEAARAAALESLERGEALLADVQLQGITIEDTRVADDLAGLRTEVEGLR